MPPTSSPTKPGTRRLSDVAKHLVAPTGITSTGWPAVRKTCNEKLGVRFDDWQESTGRLILARREDGTLAAMIDGVGMSLPRQVGKTYLVGAMIFALCVNTPGLLVIWSAHHARTHGETFLAMQAFAQRAKVKAHVRQVFTGSGDEEIRFHNESRILFGARERGFGRGIPGVDALIFDEAQILSDRALSNMLATMNTSRFGLALYIGTPPKPEDNSESFRRMRTDALAGRLTDGAWIELGAALDADPADRKQWAKANPSYPLRTPAQSILRLQRKLTMEDFLREGMGVWDEDGGSGILPLWSSRAVDREPPPVVSIGLGVSLDEEWGSIAACGFYDDVPNLGAVDRRPGSAWMPAEAKRIQDETDCAVVIDEKCPDKALISALEEEGVTLTIAKLEDNVEACSDLRNRVKEGGVTHLATDWLDNAVRAAAWRFVGDRRVIGRKQSSGHVEMLEAAVMALWGAKLRAIDVWELWT